MRVPSWGLAGLFLILLAPAVATAQGVELQHGQRSNR